MARAKRKNVSRYGCGKVKEAPPLSLLHRAKLVGSANAKSADSESIIGQMYLRGLLNDGPGKEAREHASTLRDIGYRLQRLHRAYKACILAPQVAASHAGGEVGGRAADNTRYCERVAKSFRADWAKLSDGGPRVLRAMLYLLHEDRTAWEMTGEVKLGLQILAQQNPPTKKTLDTKSGKE